MLLSVFNVRILFYLITYIYFRIKLLFKKLKFKKIKIFKKLKFLKKKSLISLSKKRFNSILKFKMTRFYKRRKFFKKKKKFSKKNYFFYKTLQTFKFINFNKFKKKKILKKKGFLLIPKKYLKSKNLKKFKKIKSNRIKFLLNFRKFFKKIFFKKKHVKIKFFKIKFFKIKFFKIKFRKKRKLFFKKKKILKKNFKKIKNLSFFKKFKTLFKKKNFKFKLRKLRKFKKKNKRYKFKRFRKLKFFKKRCKFVLKSTKLNFFFYRQNKNNLITLFNIKYIKNLRLFLFYNNYVKFNFKKRFFRLRKRWTSKAPLIRLNFFYKMHMFMKSFRAQILTYELVNCAFKSSVMVFFKLVKVLYPLEYVWFREYNLARILVRLHIISSYKLGLILILNNWIFFKEKLNIFSILTYNSLYSILLNFYTISLVKFNFRKMWALVRLFRKIRYIHRKIIKLMMKNYYLQLLTHMNQLWSKYFEIDFKQLCWIYLYSTTLKWNAIYFSWFNYWNSRVFGWKYIT